MESKEQKMEARMEAVEKENKELKEEVGEQAKELKALESGKPHKKTHGALVDAGRFASEPWNATFTVQLHGKKGGQEETFTIRVHPDWAPNGAKRFQELVQQGVLSGERFFRVVPNFMVQFGIPGEPKTAAAWRDKRIPDDPVKKTNSRGMVTFAMAGKNTRTTQVFINYANNAFLDKKGFAPFGEVLGDGMKVVDKITSKYREKPNQGKIQKSGNAYLAKHFPDLSFVSHVETSLLPASSPKAVGGFLQGESAGEDEPRNVRGLKTFFHSKKRPA